MRISKLHLGHRARKTERIESKRGRIVSDIPGLIRSLRGETDYPDGLVLQRVAEELEWHVYALANARAEIEELKERLARTAAPEATRSV
jgi:hypothetical protein